MFGYRRDRESGGDRLDVLVVLTLEGELVAAITAALVASNRQVERKTRPVMNAAMFHRHRRTRSNCAAGDSTPDR